MTVIPIPIVAALLIHWWGSVFFQSFFLHRYGAHGMFQLSRFWQRCFHLCTYLFQGASYLNPRAYAILHRMHHYYSDKPGDPHSPRLEPNPLKMMLNTLRDYRAVCDGKHPLGESFGHDLVCWPALDAWGGTRASTLLWIGAYGAFYAVYASAAWQYLLLPVHVLMGPIHGAIVNYFGHRLGYRNHAIDDHSKNTLWFDFVTLGELFQNNHHANPNSPSFASRRFEVDPVWPAIYLMNRLRMLQLKGKTAVAKAAAEVQHGIDNAVRPPQTTMP